MDMVVEILEEKKSFEHTTFKEILDRIYAQNYWTKGIEAYAAYVYMMINFKFYDPHICKELRGCIWKMGKDDKYNSNNVERELITKYRVLFEEYKLEQLKEIWSKYLEQDPAMYIYKDSKFYFTYAHKDNELSNHYAYVATIELMKDKYGMSVEALDLGSYNNDDFKAIREKEMINLTGKFLLKSSIKALEKYFPADCE